MNTNDLRALVAEHVADLRLCAVLLDPIAGLANTAAEIRKAADELQAALDAQAGMVMVPRVPTREMLNAAIDAHGHKLCEIGALGFRMSPQRMFEQSYTAMLAAAPAGPVVAQAGGWLPIESAPRDGTRVILAWGGKSCVGYFLDNSNTLVPWAGWKVPSMEVRPEGQPILWMPLPAGPVEGTTCISPKS